MKYLAAYALLSLSGKQDISKIIFYVDAADIKKVLGAAEASVADDDLNRLIESVKGKKIHELIAAGTSKIGACAPAGNAASSAPVAK